MLSKSQITLSAPAHGPSVKFAPLARRSVPKPSPPDQLERRQSHNRARPVDSQNPGSKADLAARAAARAADAERRQMILSVTQPGRIQISNRVCSDGSEFSDLRQLGRGPASNLVQTHRSRSLQGFMPAQMLTSQPVIRSDKRPAPRVQTEPIPRRLLKKKAKPVYVPCHSRAPLAPFLSGPARMLSSISRLNPGGSIKIIQQKVHRTVLVENKKPQKAQKPHSLSPSYCSPKMKKAVRKYRIAAHEEDHQVLEGFLENNGVYLENSNLEAEDTRKPDNSTLKNTLLKRIPNTLRFRNPIRSSSVGSSQSSSSTDSNNTSSDHSNTSTASSSSNRLH
ncbi:hypothetical protein PGTUg99_030800 [Puccinia graminis f. sp. tritici]|uniref:Uncharacterized protein n=1 Tax=Puccinia graminis f. sp. tritici TaxID=56615 RepID=A0A5B0SG30_PUCGR|nr:hypothetical protein PGTUg99_030800 [Puccinia graminis f. sp. tritici]